MSGNTITLSEDQKAVLLTSLKDLHAANSQLHHWVKEEALTEEMAKILPSLIESHFSNIAELLDYDSHLQEERQRRHVEIRQANNRIRELEEQIGSSRGTEGLKEQFRYLRDKVRDWWGTEGFNHIREERFTAAGELQVEFCFSLQRYGRFSRTPVTDGRKQDEHVEHLRNKGFQFADFEKDESERLRLIDNENNRRLLTQLLRDRFPSIYIEKWDNRSSNSNSDIFIIWHIEAIIDDLTDI